MENELNLKFYKACQVKSSVQAVECLPRKLNSKNTNEYAKHSTTLLAHTHYKKVSYASSKNL